MNVPMVDVHAPIHMIRKSRYSNALKTRRSTPPFGLWEGLGALDEMEDVAIAVTKKHESVALVHVRFGQKLNPAGSQLLVCGIEIRYSDGEVANARIFHLLRASFPLRWDNLEHGAIGRAHKIIAVVFVINAKP